MVFERYNRKRQLIKKLVDANAVYTSESGMTKNAIQDLMRLKEDTLFWLTQLLPNK